MAGELSSNWKKLQAKIKAESTKAQPAPKPTTTTKPTKRKAEDENIQPNKNKKHQKSHPSRPFKTASKPPSTSSQKHKPPSKTNPKMGTTHSSSLAPSLPTLTPSLHLLTHNHDISPESLAEAYSLGHRSLPTTLLGTDTPTTPNSGLSPTISTSLGKYLAIDCEMVGTGPNGYDSALARVSIVDFHGRQVYDSYVKPREFVTDWRTHVSGIAPKHMAHAREFTEVQRTVAGLLNDRVLVGHDVKHDLAVLELEHPARMVRDTAKYSGFRKYGHGPKPALRVLAREVLGVEIQGGSHSSVEDARAAMMLFRKHKSGFDVEVATRFPERPAGGGGKGKASKKGGKKKR
ncbi:ribonuclease H-like domain-containing protein [Podospora aff. communis PSN243]|uniref:RNA exonuclease 4 n=1 Tax=Podospora aff. communis PSN243 TaxID=3040156 RepID=A0AAV9GNC9_9PEZI|nr:ribonuclease H-like domain-containing protein [Podospora aff. communis PSN243]